MNITEAAPLLYDGEILRRYVRASHDILRDLFYRIKDGKIQTSLTPDFSEIDQREEILFGFGEVIDANWRPLRYDQYPAEEDRIIKEWRGS